MNDEQNWSDDQLSRMGIENIPVDNPFPTIGLSTNNDFVGVLNITSSNTFVSQDMIINGVSQSATNDNLRSDVIFLMSEVSRLSEEIRRLKEDGQDRS